VPFSHFTKTLALAIAEAYTRGAGVSTGTVDGSIGDEFLSQATMAIDATDSRLTANNFTNMLLFI